MQKPDWSECNSEWGEMTQRGEGRHPFEEFYCYEEQGNRAQTGRESGVKRDFFRREISVRNEPVERGKLMIQGKEEKLLAQSSPAAKTMKPGTQVEGLALVRHLSWKFQE